MKTKKSVPWKKGVKEKIKKKMKEEVEKLKGKKEDVISLDVINK